jgi:hypothetical protein
MSNNSLKAQKERLANIQKQQFATQIQAQWRGKLVRDRAKEKGSPRAQNDEAKCALNEGEESIQERMNVEEKLSCQIDQNHGEHLSQEVSACDKTDPPVQQQTTNQAEAHEADEDEPQEDVNEDPEESQLVDNAERNAASVIETESSKPPKWPTALNDDFSHPNWPNLNSDDDENVSRWVLENRKVLIRTITWNLCAKKPPAISMLANKLIPQNKYVICSCTPSNI